MQPQISQSLPITETVTEYSEITCSISSVTELNEQCRIEKPLTECGEEKRMKFLLTEKGVNEHHQPIISTSLNIDSLVEQFDTDDRYDKAFIKKQLLCVPFAFRVKAKQIYNQLRKLPVNGKRDSNGYLREFGDFCRSLPINVTCNESKLELIAKNRADMCYQVASNILNEQGLGYEARVELEAIVRQNGLRPRKGKYLEGDIARYCCEKWWNNKLRKLQSTCIEKVAHYVRIISKKSQIYISDVNFANGRERKRRADVYLSTLEAINEQSDCIDLKELAKSNTSNPINRRHELMTRLHGFEVYGDKHGYAADFVTITTPSRMHPVHNSGKPNEKFDGTSPKEAQAYLTGQWAKIRAQFARDNIDYFGFRVVEPHHDGTPHWHLLMFVKPEHRALMRETMKRYALEVDGDEKGAQQYRFKVDPILKSKGSAVGYIAKYISKNIDGYGVEQDLYGNPAKNSALRICEWAGLWGIRQFQQFGGPPVSIWREARRLAINEECNISPIWRAADSGNFCEFIETLGGVNVKRKDYPVTLFKEFIETEGEYLEPIGYVVKGLYCLGNIYISRHHQWTIRKKGTGGLLSLSENEV